MKSILKTINVSSVSSFALIGMLSILVTACGSDADQNDPRRYDTTGPEITLNTRPEIEENGVITQYAIDKTVELDINQEYVELGAVARDIWDVRNLADQDTQTDEVSPVLIEGSVDSTQVGEYTISYTATDSSNNSNTVTRSIAVKDLSGPVITISGSNPLSVNLDSEFVVPLAFYTDYYDSRVDQDPSDENSEIPIESTNIIGTIDTSTLGVQTLTYIAKDRADNQTVKELTVIVAPDYQDGLEVFKNGELKNSWVLTGYDEQLGWGGCTDSNLCPNLNFGLIDDPEKNRKVVSVDHEEFGYQAGFFFSNDNSFDLRGATSNGILSFEIWSEEGTNINLAVDCPAHPDAGDSVLIEDVGVGGWQEISIPAKDLFTESCFLRNDEIAIIHFFVPGWKGPEFRLDNIEWKCQFFCDGENLPDREVSEWVKVEKTNGYEAPASYDGYDLVWSDEFDSPEIDDTKWNLINAGGGFGNRELQYYRSENASVDNGLLVITADIQRSADDELPNGESFSSAKLTTEGKYDFKHGRVDIRAAVAEGNGMWSAGWMLGANHDEIGWPRCGEVDIFEAVGGVLGGIPQEGRMVHNAYWNTLGPFAPGEFQKSSYSPTPDGGQRAWGERIYNETNDGDTFSNKFHVFSIEWDEEKIRYSIDGVHEEGKDHIFEVGQPCVWGQTPGEPELTCLEQSFDNNFYLILNVAVGGTWPKAPNETTKFPRGMLVDYVRVYQTAAQQAAQ
ncbi:MAG: glycosyl hydrolase family protein [Cellvibrionales bacterium TMED47]|nr:hypothetical protein [Porticoccaceae bacterium]RPG83825.1 MAG: glycosyl hydrolase family protein [Cellvibrionales bacterium TMED47]|tara:strand:+ start:2547 stop:4745 length:2199 start_codon:yes stop_codon:yes gene_type:complete